MAQHCDSTCTHCAREFWKWLAARNRRPKTGRSGKGDYYAEAAKSRRIAEMADEAERRKKGLGMAKQKCKAPLERWKKSLDRRPCAAVSAWAGALKAGCTWPRQHGMRKKVRAQAEKCLLISGKATPSLI